MIRGLPFVFLLLVLGQTVHAQNYNLEGFAWPAGSTVVINLGLGSNTVALQDGSSSWNASATDALDIWAGYIDFIHLSSVSSATVAQASDDDVNSVFFSNNIFGEFFGDLTLAVTVLLTNETDTVTTEADVVVNSANRFDSYRGAKQSSAYDIHRMMIHEFGHVLGLGHVLSETGLYIMEPVISDLDHPAADDIAGMRSLYGASFYYPPENVTRIGSYYNNDLYPNNNPTSFTAIGMPPGISIESKTGRFIGTATTSGVYSAVITAHGPIADVSEGYKFTILGIEEIPGLLSIIPSDHSSMLADPIRPRVYIAGVNGIDMIDTDTLAVTNLVPGFVPNARLSLSADASTLLSTQIYGSPVQESRVDLDSLTPLPSITIPGNYSAVMEGLNNQAYVAGNTDLYQFDATTGALEATFGAAAPDSSGIRLAISPDRKTLYVTREGIGGELSSYDVSGAEPVLFRHFPGTFSSLAPSSDGQFLYYVQGTTDSSLLVQARLPDLGVAMSLTSHPNLGPTSVALDGSIFQSIFPSGGSDYDPSGSYVIYDPLTRLQTSQFDPCPLKTYSPYLPLDVVFDNSGKHIFALIQNVFIGAEVWVLARDFALFPPVIRPTKNLLNISTRARVEAGESAMIGGFIVQGARPETSPDPRPRPFIAAQRSLIRSSARSLRRFRQPHGDERQLDL